MRYLILILFLCCIDSVVAQNKSAAELRQEIGQNKAKYQLG